MRTRTELVEAIRQLAAEVRELDGPDSIVPGGLEAHADLLAQGDIDHVALMRALTDEGSFPA